MKLNPKQGLHYWGTVAGLFFVTVIGIFLWWQRNAQNEQAITIISQTKVNTPVPPITATTPKSLTSQVKLDSPANSIAMGKFDETTCIHMATAMLDPVNYTTLKKQVSVSQSAAKLEVARLIKEAINSSNLHERATALLMNGQMQSRQALEDFEKKHPNCDADKSCENQLIEVGANARFDTTDQIAKMAISSLDPLLYAIAFHACNGTPTQGSCRQISARQWAQRDPNNGNAWLYVLSQNPPTLLGKPNDEFDAAMFNLSQTKTFDLEFSHLQKFQKNFVAMQNENPFVQQALNEVTMDLYMASSLPAYQHIMNYCKGNLLEDVNRRQVCDQVALNLVDNDGTMLGFAIGTKMGERLGWNQEKLIQLREEQDAMHGLEKSLIDELIKPVNNAAAQITQSCRWTVNSHKQMADRMQQGEIAYLRTLIKSQSLSKAELAATYRAHLQKLKTQNTNTRKP